MLNEKQGYMRDMIKKWFAVWCGLISGALTASCDMMHDETEDCPTGLYLSFKYDYNLQRADMFNDHVGAVSVYVFDETGHYVTCREVKNEGDYRPLADPLYAMHMDLAPGRYQFLVLAGQCCYDDMLASDRARFLRALPESGDSLCEVGVHLECESRTFSGGTLNWVDNGGLPLDTVWHGMECTPVEVFGQRPTYHKISLMRNTKKINVSLRELDDPTDMDVENYDMKIVDRNMQLRWDNSVDESMGPVVYQPHDTWNTDDRTPVRAASDDTDAVMGKIAHADFMTSRIMYHEDPADDGVLSITDKRNGNEIVRVNLPDMLSRLRSSEEIYRYSPQEFLDRGYDYQMDFFLKGGELAYVNIGISVLNWSVRVQFEEL